MNYESEFFSGEPSVDDLNRIGSEDKRANIRSIKPDDTAETTWIIKENRIENSSDRTSRTGTATPVSDLPPHVAARDRELARRFPNESWRAKPRT